MVEECLTCCSPILFDPMAFVDDDDDGDDDDDVTPPESHIPDAPFRRKSRYDVDIVLLMHIRRSIADLDK